VQGVAQFLEAGVDSSVHCAEITRNQTVAPLQRRIHAHFDLGRCHRRYRLRAVLIECFLDQPRILGAELQLDVAGLAQSANRIAHQSH